MNRLVLLVELAINKYTHWLSILMNDRILSDVNATPSNKNPLLVFETMSGFLMQYAILWDVKIDLARMTCRVAPKPHGTKWLPFGSFILVKLREEECLKLLLSPHIAYHSPLGYPSALMDSATGV